MGKKRRNQTVDDGEDAVANTIAEITPRKKSKKSDDFIDESDALVSTSSDAEQPKRKRGRPKRDEIADKPTTKKVTRATETKSKATDKQSKVIETKASEPKTTTKKTTESKTKLNQPTGKQKKEIEETVEEKIDYDSIFKSKDDLDRERNQEEADSSSDQNKSTHLKKFDFDEYVGVKKDNLELSESSEEEEEKAGEEVEKVVVEEESDKESEKESDKEVEEEKVVENVEVVFDKPKRAGRSKKAEVATQKEVEPIIVEKSGKGNKKAEKVEKEQSEEAVERPKRSTRNNAKAQEITTSKVDNTPKPAKLTKKAATSTRKGKASKETPQEEEPVEKKTKKQDSKAKSTISSDTETAEATSTTKEDKKAKKGKSKSTKQKVEPIEEESEEESLNKSIKNQKELIENQQDIVNRQKEKMATPNNNKANKKGAKSSKKAKKDPIKLVSFNCNGLRAYAKKNNLADYMKDNNVDVFCLQEIRCGENQIPEELKEIEGYHAYWNFAESKAGYSGVATFSKVEPISVTNGIESEEHDLEGRAITCEFESFYLVNVYVTNAGNNLKTLDKKRDWSVAFKDYLLKLEKSKPVVACGDFNCAHNEIDLANPKSNHKTAGFTKEEREDFTDLLDSGFTDSFRFLYPDKTGAYTFWSARTNSRAKNVGWRLDYFLLSNCLQDNLVDNIINDDVEGSDHCPITCLLELDL